MARRLVIIDGDAAGMSAAAQARRMTSAGELAAGGDQIIKVELAD